MARRYCSGQPIPHSGLSFSSSTAGAGVELMWPDPVVAIYQVMTNVPLGLLRRQVAGRRNPFRLQTAEQALHRRIVSAVPSAAHALLHPVAPELLPKQAAGVLGGLNEPLETQGTISPLP